MPAPKNNQFWKNRSKHGRDFIFDNPEILRETACEHFNWCDSHPWYKVEAVKSGDMAGELMKVPVARPYTLSGLCGYVGASESWWRNFRINKNLSKDLLTVIEWIEGVIDTQQFEGAAVGAFNANIISRKMGLADKSELTGKNGAALAVPTVIIQAPNGINIDLPSNTEEPDQPEEDGEGSAPIQE